MYSALICTIFLKHEQLFPLKFASFKPICFIVHLAVLVVDVNGHKTEHLFAPDNNNSNVMFCSLEGDPTTVSRNVGNQPPSDGAPYPTGKGISTAKLPKPTTSRNIHLL